MYVHICYDMTIRDKPTIHTPTSDVGPLHCIVLFKLRSHAECNLKSYRSRDVSGVTLKEGFTV